MWCSAAGTPALVAAWLIATSSRHSETISRKAVSHRMASLRRRPRLLREIRSAVGLPDGAMICSRLAQEPRASDQAASCREGSFILLTLIKRFLAKHAAGLPSRHLSIQASRKPSLTPIAVVIRFLTLQ